MAKKLIIFGTRPEFVKVLPIILEFKKHSSGNELVSLFTGQHNNLTEDLFYNFNFKPDFFISAKNHNNSLGFSFSYILSGIQEIVDLLQKTDKVEMIIAQGDTTSCVCAAMCAFFCNIPFTHIEAGLRTNDLQNPFPEEYFRKIISLSSTIHFVPTIHARENLLKEGVEEKKIILTGNTIVDLIQIIRSDKFRLKESSIIEKFKAHKNNVLITCHRRENQNENFQKLADGVKVLAKKYPLFNFIWISHKTPFIANKLAQIDIDGGENIFIIPPINILELYGLYDYLKIIITDSGGIQEEAPSFNIPVVVYREHTERIESVEVGYSKLSGSSTEDLVDHFNYFVDHPIDKMKNPYGNGDAAKKIVNFLNNL